MVRRRALARCVATVCERVLPSRLMLCSDRCHPSPQGAVELAALICVAALTGVTVPSREPLVLYFHLEGGRRG